MKTELVVAYIADAGDADVPQQAQAAALIAGWENCEAILAAGDNVYDNDEVAGSWAVFTNLGLPIYPVYGNHDQERAGQLDEQIAMFPHIPENDNGHKRYYSVELGDGLLRLDGWHGGRESDWTDTEPDGRDRGSAQYQYFESKRAESGAWWALAMEHWPSEAAVAGGGRVMPEIAHLYEDDHYDLTLYGHTHVARETLQGSTFALNVSSCTRVRPLATRQGATADTLTTWEDTGERHCITRIRITAEAILWEIFDVETGEVIRTHGIGAKAARNSLVRHAPLFLPTSEGGGARQTSYQAILWSAAKRAGVVPENEQLQLTMAATLTDHLNSALKYAWEFSPWPETVERNVEIVPETGGDGRRFIPWRQRTHSQGWREIGVVLDVCDPTGKRPLCYQFTEDGVGITSDLAAGEAVLLTYRRMAPEFDWQTWDATLPYKAGSLVHDPESGHGFRAFEDVPPNEALEGSRRWERLPIPYVLKEAVKAGVCALYLQEEGQYSTSALLQRSMLAQLEHEIDQLHNQQGRTRRHR